jgi:hypothetical protein
LPVFWKGSFRISWTKLQRYRWERHPAKAPDNEKRPQPAPLPVRRWLRPTARRDHPIEQRRLAGRNLYGAFGVKRFRCRQLSLLSFSSFFVRLESRFSAPACIQEVSRAEQRSTLP